MYGSMKTSRTTDNTYHKKKLHLFVRKKLALTFIISAAVLFALTVHLILIIQKNEDEYQKKILSQQGYTTSAIAFRRGSITDRNYTLLAYSEEVYNLILDPSVILYTAKESNPSPNRNCTVEALCRCFGYDAKEINAVLDEKPDSAYVRYAKSLSAEEMDRFLSYQNDYNGAKDDSGKKLHSDKVTGVWFETEYKREYPYDTLGCTVLGFSGADSSEGHWGLEEYYNNTLSGINGKSYSYMNTDGYYEKAVEDAVNGQTVVSTIDYTIQKVVQEKIKAWTADNIYTDVGVIVMDPSNAEILAMASDKSFDLNDPTDLTVCYDQEYLDSLTEEEKNALYSSLWRNYTISDVYSPGSVSKELTVAMGLEENVIDKKTIFVCDGGEKIGGTYVGCNATHGTLKLAETLMWSCNDGMMNIANRVDVATFLRYQSAFGLGEKTGIDLPGEAAGILFTESNMTALDLATCSFGQGYSSTMIQMAAAYCSLINGGYYYQPRIVRQILSENGAVMKTMDPVLVRQTVTEDTAAFMRKAAFDTVDSGSCTAGQVPGYKVGGKTGTAQKYPIEEHKYVVSFMAFAPADDPDVLVYVVINEPEHEGTVVSNHGAIELEQSIMAEILPYLGVAKTE